MQAVMRYVHEEVHGVRCVQRGNRVCVRPQRMDGWSNFTVHGTGQGAWDFEQRTREIQNL
jgi:hypothetical protein